MLLLVPALSATNYIDPLFSPIVEQFVTKYPAE